MGVGRGEGIEGREITGLQQTVPSTPWLLKDLTEGAVAIRMGSLFLYFMTRIEKEP